MCVALVAVDAMVKISNPGFDRLERIQDFFRLPGDTPNIQTRLGPDELITGIDLPPLPAGARSMYLKVRDRTSYAYALTSAAVVLTQNAEGMIDHVRVALGGVGSVPWRSHEVENVLLRNPPTEAVFREAAEAAFAEAVPYQYNGFKIALGKDTLVRVLNELVHSGAGELP